MFLPLGFANLIIYLFPIYYHLMLNKTFKRCVVKISHLAYALPRVNLNSTLVPLFATIYYIFALVCLHSVMSSYLYFFVEINCGNPGTLMVNVHNNYNYGSSVEFACIDNYTLAGTRKITCEETSTKDWSSPIPRCCGELYFMLTVILRPNPFLSCNLEVN